VVIDLPEVPDLYLIEGSIYNGEPPLVFVGKAQGYFDSAKCKRLHFGS
jgi:hypothetical protein